ncbi:MFS transporter [Deltaproteobacteria bacterium OttesenSCG-928-M10]|nr:MFS transporter [Deltaproteobacteria bacterium OttesenSCG-928-M10]
MGKKLKGRNLVQFLVLGCGSNAIFYILFSRGSYYDAFMEAFSVTNTQFGFMSTVALAVSSATYFIGGILADKVHPRLLVTTSFIVTGFCNFFLGFFPSYGAALLLYGIMGASTTFTFWGSFLKLTRQFGREVGSESKAFGAMEGTRSVFAILAATFAVFMFSRFDNSVSGLRFVMWMYAAMLVIFGILAFFAFDDKNDGNKEDVINRENPFKMLVYCLKDPDIWLVGLMAMGGYTVGSVIGSYLGTFGRSAFGITVATAAYVGLLNQWCKPVGNFSVGFFGDKFGPSKVILFLNIVLTGIAIFFAFMPKTSSLLVLFLVVIALEITLTGAFRGQMYAPMRECRVPMNLTGSAIGFYATLIYATDAILPPIIGQWLDNLPMEEAWRNVFLLVAAFGVLGIVTSMMFRIRNKKNIAEVRQEEIQARKAALKEA